MPWESHGRESSLIHDLVTLIARVWTGSMLLVFYTLDAVSGAWAHIWREEPWPLLTSVAGVTLPAAALAIAAAILLLACLGLLAGLFTRFSALLVLIVLIGALSVVKGDRDSVELILCYLLGPVIALLLGSGSWSLDKVMSSGRRSRVRG